MNVQLDLLCLVADTNMRETLKALLPRDKALGIRALSSDYAVHPEHDPGCFGHAPDFLRPFLARARHALVLFDLAGSGCEPSPREEVERDLERRLRQSGWNERAAAIAIDPELENWIWTDSPHVGEALGWGGRDGALRERLTQAKLWSPLIDKPGKPKEAVEMALRDARIPRSSSIYRRLAGKVKFSRCQDPAFLKLCATLRRWFPIEAG